METTVDSTVNEVGAKPNETPVQPKVETESPRMVDKSQLDHALKDLHRFKDEAKQLKEQLENLNKEKLKASNDWKTLAELNEQKAKDAEAKVQALTQATVYDRKMNAVVAALRAKGLRKEAEIDVEALDLSEIQVETTNTGRINILNAEEFAERQKTIRPHWFAAQAPKVNADSPTVMTGGGKVTVEEISKEFDKAQKSGDYTTYRAKLGLYQKQKHGG